MPWVRYTDPVSPATYGAITAISGANDLADATGETKSGEITGTNWDADCDLSGQWYSNGTRVQRGLPVGTTEQRALWNRRIGAAFRYQMGLTKDWWPSAIAVVPAAAGSEQEAVRIATTVNAQALLATRRWIEGNGIIVWMCANGSGPSALTDAHIEAMLSHYEFMGDFVDPTTWATLGAGTQLGDGTVVSHWYRVFTQDSMETQRNDYAGQSFGALASLYSDLFSTTNGALTGGVTVPNGRWSDVGLDVATGGPPDLDALR